MEQHPEPDKRIETERLAGTVPVEPRHTATVPLLRRFILDVLLLVMLGLGGVRQAPAADPLPSWAAGSAKSAVMAFVNRVAKPGGPDFVPPAERIAVFDNDGTLWAEQPAYVQLLFAIDRVKALAPEHPEWRERPSLRAALDGDMAALAASGETGAVELIMATHAGMTTDEFARIVSDWMATARHPRFGRPYTEMAYQPMLELLAYLRANGFKTYIVSGGGVEFMRPWTERVYGVPPEQVVGSAIATRFEWQDGKPVLRRQAKIDFVDDRGGKPVGIHKFIGRRPIAAFGNSDGDLEMLQWTTAGTGPRCGLIVRHTDAKREWAYDRDSPVGRLDKALDEATRRGWIVVDMKKDWKTVFPSAAGQTGKPKTAAARRPE
jgi:phosphoserine phosphatase